jgi:glycosyltransferase involved in cell wall biosynthesis
MSPPDAKAREVAIYMADFHGGGVERMTMMLAEAFLARGVEVTIVVNRSTGVLRSLLPAAVRLVSLDVRRSIFALPGLVRFLRRESPSVLMSSLGHSNIVALWARAIAEVGRRRSTRIVICQHNTLSVEAHEMSGFHYAALPTLYRWFGPLADGIVGVSNGVSDDLARSAAIARDRITTIYNPVIGPDFESSLNDPASHSWLLDRSLKVIVGLGRLVPQKGFATLIDAFARLGRADTRLVIFGDGPDMEKLKSLAAELGVADRVDLPGFSLSPLPVLRDASVMVLSSTYEGLGNALVEALATGTAVVSTRCPYGPAEILEDGRYGELVPVGDAQAMALAIARQLDDPQPLEDMRRRRAMDFHVDIATDAYLTLLLGSSMRPFDTPARTPAEREHASAFGEVMVYIPALRMGGAEMSLLRLAEGMADRGVHVVLVVNDAAQGRQLAPPGIELISLDTQRSLGAIRRLTLLMEQRKPRTLLTAFPHSNMVAVLARRLSGVDCKVVISEHAPLSRQVAFMGGWRYRLLPMLARVAYPRAAAVVAVSRGVASDLEGLIRGLEPKVIHNPVLAPRWAESAGRPPGHAWLEDESVEVVLSASRLSTEKDLPTLLRAFAIVAVDRPAARLLIAGEGPARAAIERLVVALGLTGKVQLAGAIGNPLSWMRRAGVFVLASRFEGFGNVLVEALAAGTQVVSTDCPVGPREVLRDGALGQLVPVGDHSAMASAIIAALQRSVDEPARVRASVQANSEDVAGVYTQDEACRAYLALFARLRGEQAPAFVADTLQD